MYQSIEINQRSEERIKLAKVKEQHKNKIYDQAEIRLNEKIESTLDIMDRKRINKELNIKN